MRDRILAALKQTGKAEIKTAAGTEYIIRNAKGVQLGILVETYRGTRLMETRSLTHFALWAERVGAEVR